MNQASQKIKNYLLGKITPDEFEEIDLRVISEAGFEDELIRGENDLMEDYLDGLLSNEEIELFFKNFLTSPDRKQYLTQIRLLREIAVKSQKPDSVEAERKDQTDFFPGIKRLFELILQPVPAALLILVLGLTGFIIWQIFPSQTNTDLARLQEQTVRLNQKNLTAPEDFKGMSVISLTPGIMRDNDGAKKVNVQNLAPEVFCRLAVPAGVQIDSDSRAVIYDPGGDSLFVENISVISNQNGTEVRLLIPSEFIKPGIYRIEISTENSGKLPLVYSFAGE